MDEELDRLVIRVRADTAAFGRDVRAMRDSLDGPLGAGADRAGRAVEDALLRAVRTGKLGFDDLKASALKVLGEIASATVRAGLADLFGGGGGERGAGGLAGVLGGILGGLPGRAMGGPVSPARPYLVGERGPELFVPAASGRVAPLGAPGNPRDVRVAITIHAAGDAAPAALARSGRQVARAVRAALREE